MKILGVVCSPRSHGNTEVMIQEALTSAQEAGAEIELLTLAGKTIAPCDACNACLKTGECRIKDDMQEIYTKLLEADGIILGTPVYFWTVTAQAKALMDRTWLFREGRKLRGKIGGIVVVANRAGGTSAFSVLNNFLSYHRMIVAGGAIGFGGFESGYEKGAVRNDAQGMAEARAVGRAVVRYVQRYRAQ